MAKTIRELVLEFFVNHPNQELSHGPVVDWVTEQYVQEHGSPPRDPWRTIRQLHQEGKLIKIRQGIYKYDPNYEHEVVLFEFSPRDREAIFERDDRRCVLCGRGEAERIIAETDLDGTYVLTAEALEESDKVKLFEHFIEDFKKLIEQN